MLTSITIMICGTSVKLTFAEKIELAMRVTGTRNSYRIYDFLISHGYEISQPGLLTDIREYLQVTYQPVYDFLDHAFVKEPVIVPRYTQRKRYKR